MRYPYLAILAVAMLLSASSVRGSDWPQYRGAAVDGISRDAVFGGLDPVGLELSWKQPIGSGYSGVAIAGGRVVTMFSDGKNDVAAAFDEGDGRELWRFDIEPTYLGHDGSHTGPISTPLIAGGRVIGLGARGRLFALDAASGKPIWSVDLVKTYGSKSPVYGFATSPILVDGTLIVQIGSEEGAVAGFDPENGTRRWSVGKDSINYQSPVPFSFAGRSQVLVAGQTKLFGLDAGSGEILWDYDHAGAGFIGAKSMVPIPVGQDRVFLAAKEDTSAMVRLQSEGEAVRVGQVWEHRSIHNTYTVPVYYDGHLYGYSSRFLTCVDAATGETVWRSRQPGDGFLTLVDGHLVVLTKQGSLHVAPASPRGYEEIVSLQALDGQAWTDPSVANGAIYVRGLDGLARVDIGQTRGAGSAVAGAAAPIEGTRFARFLSEVERSADKKSVVDAFMAANDDFPLIEGDRVHFIYRGAANDMAIAGDMIGARLERPMTWVAGTDLFYFSTTLKQDAHVAYVFIRDYEELTDPLNPRTMNTIVVGPEMEPRFDEREEMQISWLGMPGWKPSPYLAESEEGRRGRIEVRGLDSQVLSTKHEIDVYLPTDYDDGDRRYPVVFIHGGQTARKWGELTTILDHIIGSRVQPIIAVFIKTTPPFGNYDPYAAMVAQELIPLIDGQYRTTALPSDRAHVGAGWSGYTALYCTFRYPGTVGRVGSHSAQMLDFMRGGLVGMFTLATDHPLELYLDWGAYDLKAPDEAWDMTRTNRDVARRLGEKGYAPAGGESSDGPGWKAWRTRSDELFEALFPAK